MAVESKNSELDFALLSYTNNPNHPRVRRYFSQVINRELIDDDATRRANAIVTLLGGIEEAAKKGGFRNWDTYPAHPIPPMKVHTSYLTESIAQAAQGYVLECGAAAAREVFVYEMAREVSWRFSGHIEAILWANSMISQVCEGQGSLRDSFKDNLINNLGYNEAREEAFERSVNRYLSTGELSDLERLGENMHQEISGDLDARTRVFRGMVRFAGKVLVWDGLDHYLLNIGEVRVKRIEANLMCPGCGGVCFVPQRWGDGWRQFCHTCNHRG